jgi:hypothetical protein
MGGWSGHIALFVITFVGHILCFRVQTEEAVLVRSGQLCRQLNDGVWKAERWLETGNNHLLQVNQKSNCKESSQLTNVQISMDDFPSPWKSVKSW